MSAREVAIADAVVSEINSGTYTTYSTIASERVPLVTTKLELLENLAAPKVEVVPFDSVEGGGEEGNQKRWRRTYTVVITIQDALAPATVADATLFKAAVDARCLLCEEIELRFARERDQPLRRPVTLAARPSATVTDYQRTVVYDYEALFTEGRFAGEVQLKIFEWN